MNDLRIVIPAYNEEECVGEIIDRLRKACINAEIIVVDDCSKDRTGQIARSRNVILLTNTTNLGYGKALKKGFNYQSNQASPIKYIAFLDADGTYPPEGIPELYRQCMEKGYDIAVGSRLSRTNTGMPGMRKLGNHFFAWLISAYTGRKISDTASGLRVFKANLVPWMDSLPNDLSLTPAMTIRAMFAGLTYIEMPIVYSRRIGSSKLSSLRDGYRFLSVILRTTREYRPVLFYCTLGLPFILIDYVVNGISSLRAENLEP